MTTTEEHLQSPFNIHVSTHTYFHSALSLAGLLSCTPALHCTTKSSLSRRYWSYGKCRQICALIKKERKKKKPAVQLKIGDSLWLTCFLIYLDTGNTSSATFSSSSSSPAAAPFAPEDVGTRGKSLSLLRLKDPSQLYRRFTL